MRGRQPEWSRGKSHAYLRPYWDGHMFVAIYLHSCGYSYRTIGRVLGCSTPRAEQMVKKAQRIIATIDARGYARDRQAALKAQLIGGVA